MNFMEADGGGTVRSQGGILAFLRVHEYDEGVLAARESQRGGSTWAQWCKTWGTESSRHPTTDIVWRFSRLPESAGFGFAARLQSI